MKGLIDERKTLLDEKIAARAVIDKEILALQKEIGTVQQEAKYVLSIEARPVIRDPQSGAVQNPGDKVDK